MTVKQLIMHLVEMPQNAEVVCCGMTSSYLNPYSVDFVRLEETSKSRPHLIFGNSQNDDVKLVDKLVAIGSKREIEYIERKFFPFKEFFKPGHERVLDKKKYSF